MFTIFVNLHESGTGSSSNVVNIIHSDLQHRLIITLADKPQLNVTAVGLCSSPGGNHHSGIICSKCNVVVNIYLRNTLFDGSTGTINLEFRLNCCNLYIGCVITTSTGFVSIPTGFLKGRDLSLVIDLIMTQGSLLDIGRIGTVFAVCISVPTNLSTSGSLCFYRNINVFRSGHDILLNQHFITYATMLTFG